MNVTKNNYLYTLVFLTFVVIVLLSGCSKKKIVTNEDYLSEVSLENISIKEYEQFMISEKSNNEEKNKGDLEKEINKYATISFIEDSYMDTGTISCKIIAPDVYSYMMLNEKNFMEMESEAISTAIIDACKRGDLEEREVTIILPAKIDKGVIIADTSGEEYKDAVSGGLYSAICDIYRKSMQEIGEN